MSRSVAVILSLILALVIGMSGCNAASSPAPAPTPATTTPATTTPAPAATPVPMPTPVFVNSGTSSTTAELEAKIKQLEAENQRLLTENQELKNKLLKVKSVQSEIPNLLIMATQVQNDASQLAAFLKSLPTLPTPPPGLDDISKVNDIITKAISLRTILKKLPPPPPLIAPAGWYELDKMKNEFIRMTEWMEDLEELPAFLNIAGDLDDLRSQEISHLENISVIMSNIKSVLERIQK